MKYVPIVVVALLVIFAGYAIFVTRIGNPWVVSELRKDPDGARAEIFFHLMRAPVFPSRTVYLSHTIRVQTRRTLRLADMNALAALKVDTARYSELDYTRTQAIADAAYFLGFDGLLVPSARWECRSLIIFMDRIDPNDDLAVNASEPVDWQAWRTRQSAPDDTER